MIRILKGHNNSDFPVLRFEIKQNKKHGFLLVSEVFTSNNSIPKVCKEGATLVGRIVSVEKVAYHFVESVLFGFGIPLTNLLIEQHLSFGLTGKQSFRARDKFIIRLLGCNPVKRR